MPELTEQELQDAINGGEVTLLTVDTNIFEQYKNGLEFGLLKRLSQFLESEINLVLSDIVLRELQKHMVIQAKDAEAKLASGLKSVGGTWNIPRERREELREGLLGGRSADEAVGERIDAFQRSTGFEIVRSEDYATIADLVDGYFETTPPFGNKPDKKHEFPDAMAVNALERYAAERDTLMLVVSNDGGWKEFCAASGHLVCVSELGTAMAYLQRLPHVIAASLSERFDEGLLPELQRRIEDELAHYIDGMDMHIQASAPYYYEPDLPEKIYRGIEHLDDPKFIVVEHHEDDEIYVLETSLVASVEVNCDFTFYITDPIDKDEVPIGSVLASRTEEMPFVLTVTIMGDPQGEFDIDEVEIIQSENSIDFDYIEPDYGEPDE